MPNRALLFVLVPLAGLALGACLVMLSVRVSPLVAGIALLAMIGGIALVRFPYLIFLMTVAVVPMERLGRLTADSSAYTISLMRLLGMLAVGSMLLHAVVHRWPLRFNVAFFVYCAYFVLAVVSATYSTDPISSVRTIGAIIGNILFFFLVINMVQDWDTARRAIWIWLGATLLTCLYTVYNWHFGAAIADAGIGEIDTRFSVVHDDTSEHVSLDTVRRALGPTSHSAVYAINLILTVPFFLYLLRTNLPRMLWWATAAGLLMVLYNILLANTRAAILLTALLLAFCAYRGLVSLKPGTLFVGLLAGIALLPFVPASTWDRVLDASNYSLERSGTLQIRLEYWQSALKVIQENWLAGVGVGNTVEVPKHVNSITASAPSATAHMEYLQTFLELGIFGWLLFMTFLGLTLSYAFKAAAYYKHSPGGEDQYWFLVALQVSMIGVIIYGLQVDVYHFPLKGWWLIAGIAAAVYSFTRNPQYTPQFSSKRLA